MGCTGGKQRFLAFHHIHKAHRHGNDQGRPQPGLDLLHNGQQGGGGIAHRKDGPGVLLRRAVHGGHCPGGSGLGCDPRHLRVRHVAEGTAAQPGKGRLGNARKRHVGVGDDRGPGPQGGHTCRHSPRREAQIFRIVKVGGGVDDPLDHSGSLGRRGQALRFQLCRDDGKACPLNVGGQMMLWDHCAFLRGFSNPMAA